MTENMLKYYILHSCDFIEWGKLWYLSKHECKM